MNWLFYSVFNLLHFVNPLLAKQIKSEQIKIADNPSDLETAYSIIEQQRRIIMTELGIAA